MLPALLFADLLHIDILDLIHHGFSMGQVFQQSVFQPHRSGGELRSRHGLERDVTPNRDHVRAPLEHEEQVPRNQQSNQGSRRDRHRAGAFQAAAHPLKNAVKLNTKIGVTDRKYRDPKDDKPSHAGYDAIR